MAANRFLELYRSGRISDLRSLTRTWHELVKRSHPDATGSEGSAALFDRLNAEYREAKQVLAAVAEPVPAPQSNPFGPPPGREAFYREFRDILSRGFPLDPENPRLPGPYFQSRRLMAAWLGSLVPPLSFAGFEADLLSLKQNSTYLQDGPLLPFLYRVTDFQLGGDPADAAFAVREWPAMRRLLERRNKSDLVAVLQYLMEDLP